MDMMKVKPTGRSADGSVWRVPELASSLVPEIYFVLGFGIYRFALKAPLGEGFFFGGLSWDDNWFFIRGVTSRDVGLL
jgi:hypothetical protein